MPNGCLPLSVTDHSLLLGRLLQAITSWSMPYGRMPLAVTSQSMPHGRLLLSVSKKPKYAAWTLATFHLTPYSCALNLEEIPLTQHIPWHQKSKMHCKMRLLWRVLMTFRVLKTNGITSSMRCSLWLKVVFLLNCFTKSVNDKLIYSWPTVFVFWPCYLCPVPLVSFAQNTVTMK